MLNIVGLCGGKGGFGSMLRAAGKVNKTTNNLACRDLLGRRIRYTEQEKELTEWIKEQKSNEQPTNQEIQNDFRNIKKYGRPTEKRMCYKGDNCKYKYKCKFRHPSDGQNVISKKNNKSKGMSGLNMQSDKDMENIIYLGKLYSQRKNAFDNYIENQNSNDNNDNNKSTKKLLTLYGTDDEDSDLSDHSTGNNDNNNDNNSGIDIVQQGFMSKYHEHKLVYNVRTDCDYIICDHCHKEFVGPAWHCINKCDFDLCDNCVNIREDFIDMDIPQNDNQEINDDSELEMSHAIKKRKITQERKLHLLGLDIENNHVSTNDNIPKNNNNNNNTGITILNDATIDNVKVGQKRSIPSDTLSPFDANKHMISIDLNKYKKYEELCELGFERLKNELKKCGLKYGGTINEKAKRLFLLKSKPFHELPKSVKQKNFKSK